MPKPNWFDLLGAAVVWLAVLSAARGAEPTITAVPFPPTDKPGPGTVMVIDTSGLEPDQEARVHWLPKVEGDLVLDLDKDGLPPFLFAGTAAGPRSLVLQVKLPGWDLFIPCTFDYGGPAPDPPPPPPPPKVERLMALVVTEESNPRQGVDARLADWNFIVRSPRIWKWLKENGHLIEVRDKDSTVERTNVPGGLAPWIERLGDAPLPHVFLFDLDTADCVADCPVPGIAEKSDEAFFDLVKKWGAEK